MTFWEKLISEYPDMKEYTKQSKATKCPSSWGYEVRQKGMCWQKVNCEQCWDRQVPEQKVSA